jgi:hypothetical protein
LDDIANEKTAVGLCEDMTELEKLTETNRLNLEEIKLGNELALKTAGFGAVGIFGSFACYRALAIPF